MIQGATHLLSLNSSALSPLLLALALLRPQAQ